MHNMILPIAALIGSVLLAGCQATNTSNTSNTDVDKLPGDNDQMACPMIYDPVCATINTGLHCAQAPCPTIQKETFSNSCMASISVASPATILSIEDGACAGDE